MFWGSRGKKEAERAELRESLQIADDSPVRDVLLRNDFEHFDERLEAWFGGATRTVFVGRNIGPASMIRVENDPESQERFQHFDPEAGTVTFWAHTVSLRDVLTEISRILPLAEAESQKPHWE